MPPNRALHRSVQKGARWVIVLSGIMIVALGMTMLSAARVLFGAFVTVQEDSSLLVNSSAILAPGEASILPGQEDGSIRKAEGRERVRVSRVVQPRGRAIITLGNKIRVGAYFLY